MKITDVAFVAYPSDDVAGTRTWYENTLGRAFAGAYIEDGVEKYNEAHLATPPWARVPSRESSPVNNRRKGRKDRPFVAGLG